jgi:hypothetical protein
MFFSIISSKLKYKKFNAAPIFLYPCRIDPTKLKCKIYIILKDINVIHNTKVNEDHKSKFESTKK